MEPTFRFAFLMLLLLAAGCERAGEPEPPQPPDHAEYGEALADSAIAATLLGGGWLEAAETAVLAPTLFELPHHERGVFLPAETRAIGIAFDAIEGQRLHLTLEISEDSTGRLFADIWFLDLSGESAQPRHLTTLAALQGGVLPLEESGRYVLRLQPELLASIDYSLRLELDAALAFPVSEHGRRHIGSIFGDPRDGGRRRHEGIDIFAPRATPVIAVSDGTAIPRRSKLGGNTVWLRGAGKSFYYAHLDKVAIEGRRRVDAGEVLGFVGNTGNAITAPPHLHFGIYRSGRGATDPLPYVVARTFAAPPPPTVYEAGFATVTADELNLRPSPGTASAALDRLQKGALLQVTGAAGEWLRVRTIDDERGWIHGNYQASLAGPRQREAPASDAWLLGDAGDGVPVARVRADTTLHVFAQVPGWQLVGDRADEPLGWLASPAAVPAD